MQADRFTVKSQEALAAAQRLAGARRNPEVVPYHLLVALLEQDGGIVDPVLRAANVDPERVRRQANEKLDALPEVTGDATEAAVAAVVDGPETPPQIPPTSNTTTVRNPPGNGEG